MAAVGNLAVAEVDGFAELGQLYAGASGLLAAAGLPPWERGGFSLVRQFVLLGLGEEAGECFVGEGEGEGEVADAGALLSLTVMASGSAASSTQCPPVSSVWLDFRPAVMGFSSEVQLALLGLNDEVGERLVGEEEPGGVGSLAVPDPDDLA